MPSPDSIADKIRYEGQWISITRVLDDGSTINADVPAFVRGYQPDELVNDIQQGDREMRIAPVDLYVAGLPDAPQRPDQVSIEDKTAIVQSCETRFLRGVPAMFVVQIRGG